MDALGKKANLYEICYLASPYEDRDSAEKLHICTHLPLHELLPAVVAKLEKKHPTKKITIETVQARGDMNIVLLGIEGE